MARTGVDPAMMAWSTLPRRVEHLSNDGYCMNHHHHHHHHISSVQWRILYESSSSSLLIYRYGVVTRLSVRQSVTESSVFIPILSLGSIPCWDSESGIHSLESQTRIPRVWDSFPALDSLGSGLGPQYFDRLLLEFGTVRIQMTGTEQAKS